MVELFVGIDWGSQTHSVCVVDSTGEKLLEEEVAHRGEDVLAFIKRLMALAQNDPARLCAGMEAPQGVMVEALLERGITTYSINPKQLDRFRDRHSVAGAKDDDLDAYVLATSLRTDLALFRKIEIPSEFRLELTALSRSYETLTEQALALANQLGAQLLRYYPQMAELGDNWHQEPWLWDLFEAAPTPAHVSKLSLKKVEAILKTHRISRYQGQDVLKKLKETALPVAQGVPNAAARRVAMLLPVLRVVHQQRRQCDREMKAFFADLQRGENDSPENAHHDAALLLSLPGIGIHNGAVMLAEAYCALQQRDYQALRRLAGVAPVSRRIGGRSKRPVVLQRQACNRRLREATYHWGRVALQRDRRTREHYDRLRAAGQPHGRAIRGVVDRLLAVLCAVLKSGKPYDAKRRLQCTKTALAA
jgi:transposase